MPRDAINSNITSKENTIDRSDIDDIIKAGRALRISVDNFVSALERFSDKIDNASVPPVSDTTAEKPDTVGSAIPHDFFLSEDKTSEENQQGSDYSRRNHGKNKPSTVSKRFGVKVGDIVRVDNTVKIGNYVVPVEYRYGKVTHFNKRFVFFDLRHKRGDKWYTEKVWRESKNLSIFRQS